MDTKPFEFEHFPAFDFQDGEPFIEDGFLSQVGYPSIPDTGHHVIRGHQERRKERMENLERQHMDSTTKSQSLSVTALYRGVPGSFGQFFPDQYFPVVGTLHNDDYNLDHSKVQLHVGRIPYRSLSAPNMSTKLTQSMMFPNTHIDSNNNALPVIVTQGRFTLKQQPNPVQRKSYVTEKRYLLPNPIVVCAVDDPENSLPRVCTGNVSIELVTGKGDCHISDDSIFEVYPARLIKLRPDATAEFIIKILRNSGPEQFALRFTVMYCDESGQLKKEIFDSIPFSVQSNKALKAKGEITKVTSMQPKIGPAEVPNEVWIKGISLRKPGMVVTFDGVEAQILEQADNLLVVLAPVRPDLTHSFPAQVVLKHNGEIIKDHNLLIFTYQVSQPWNQLHQATQTEDCLVWTKQ